MVSIGTACGEGEHLVHHFAIKTNARQLSFMDFTLGNAVVSLLGHAVSLPVDLERFLNEESLSSMAES